MYMLPEYYITNTPYRNYKLSAQDCIKSPTWILVTFATKAQEQLYTHILVKIFIRIFDSGKPSLSVIQYNTISFI